MQALEESCRNVASLANCLLG